MLDSSQQKIVNAKENNICVIAGAGSGKTRCLVARVEKLLKDGADPAKMICITFTNMAAQEMRSRLSNIPGSDKLFIGTIHSFAYRIMRKAGKRFGLLTQEKEDEFMEYLVTKYAKYLTLFAYQEWSKARKKVQIGILKNYEMRGILTDDQEAERMVLADNHDVTYLFRNKEKYTEKELAYKILMEEKAANTSKNYPENIKTLAQKNGIITFNALLEECRALIQAHKEDIEYLFVDEFQDVGVFEYRFLLGLNAKHVFVVGDDYQCQPKGTKVLMFDGSEKLIEDIQIGDAVTAYNNNGKYIQYTKHFKDRYACRVKDISVHQVKQIHDIKTNSSNNVKYTYNHKCYTSIHKQGNEDSYLLYIIKNDKGWYRIGHCNTFYKANGYKFAFPVVMQKEKATEGWILNCYKNYTTLKETMNRIMRDFNICRLSWIPRIDKDNTLIIEDQYTQRGDQTLQVAQCLKEFNRSIEFPFRYRNDERHFTDKWMFVTQACNLIPDLMDLFMKTKEGHNRTRIVYNIIRRDIYTVYGLDVDKFHNYVGDKFLTHNSIYGFKGADFSYFKSLTESDKFRVYKLNNNYRCSPKIVKYSNAVINTIDDVLPKKCISKCKNDYSNIIKEEGGKSVVIKYVSLIDSRDYGKWFILTRNNNDAIDIGRMLYHRNIPYTTFKQASLTAEKLEASMKENTIKLLTIHSAKGLEAENVIMYGNFPEVDDIDDIFLGKYGTEAVRIMYVGITRAKNNLVIVNNKGTYN